jgi:hypothetical protein
MKVSPVKIEWKWFPQKNSMNFQGMKASEVFERRDDIGFALYKKHGLLWTDTNQNYILLTARILNQSNFSSKYVG